MCFCGACALCQEGRKAGIKPEDVGKACKSAQQVMK
jgi:hypothetical protein